MLIMISDKICIPCLPTLFLPLSLFYWSFKSSDFNTMKYLNLLIHYIDLVTDYRQTNCSDKYGLPDNLVNMIRNS